MASELVAFRPEARKTIKRRLGVQFFIGPVWKFHLQLSQFGSFIPYRATEKKNFVLI